MTSKHRFRRFRSGLVAVVVAWMGLAGCSHDTAADGRSPPGGAAYTAAPAGPDTPLHALVAPPDDAVLQMYMDAGATGATAHALTDRERKLVEDALAALPQLHRAILERHLARLSFIDAPKSAGTGLTRELDPDGSGLARFDITLRADVLDMPLSEFLTVKEARLFEDDQSGLGVEIDAGSAPALPYILLHEATHVVDGVLGISVCEDSPFRRGVWTDYRELAQPHAAGPVARTPFRRAPKVPISEAPALYAALGESPFPSLYATASSAEDLAELVAWRAQASNPGAPPEIRVLDRAGRTVFRADPLAPTKVRRRLALVDALLDLGPSAIDAGYSFCAAAKG